MKVTCVRRTTDEIKPLVLSGMARKAAAAGKNSEEQLCAKVAAAAGGDYTNKLQLVKSISDCSWCC